MPRRGCIRRRSFLEFDTFLDIEGNEKLLARLRAKRSLRLPAEGAVEVAVFPEVVKPLEVFPRFRRIASLLVDLPREYFRNGG
jgi:hypothetical protein